MTDQKLQLLPIRRPNNIHSFYLLKAVETLCILKNIRRLHGLPVQRIDVGNFFCQSGTVAFIGLVGLESLLRRFRGFRLPFFVCHGSINDPMLLMYVASYCLSPTSLSIKEKGKKSQCQDILSYLQEKL